MELERELAEVRERKERLQTLLRTPGWQDLADEMRRRWMATKMAATPFNDIPSIIERIKLEGFAEGIRFAMSWPALQAEITDEDWAKLIKQDQENGATR